MSIEVLRPGLLMTVQDAGRWGFRKNGVSICGALDDFALRTGNILVGNPLNASVIEITLANSQFHFHDDSVIAICGGDLAPLINDKAVPSWRPLLVKAGGILHFSSLQSGCRANLAVAGGINVPIILGSRSTDLRAGFGGHEGRALRAGDTLHCATPDDENSKRHGRLVDESFHQNFFAPRWFISTHVRPSYDSKVVRVLRGGEFMSFSERSRMNFFADEFIVTPEANRMAYRLSGRNLHLTRAVELLSTAVTPGAIQVPPDGIPVLLLADCQTTGGYPVIAHVASVDLPVVAQKKPGDSLRFSEISLSESHSLYLQREKDIAALKYAVQCQMK